MAGGAGGGILILQDVSIFTQRFTVSFTLCILS